MRQILVPDLGTELLGALRQVEFLFNLLRDPAKQAPPPLGGGDAWRAITRLQIVIAPQQNCFHRPPGIVTPDSTYHLPLRPVLVDPIDVALLTEAGKLIGQLANPERTIPAIRAALELATDVDRVFCPETPRPDALAGLARTVDELVVQVARIAGLLDLEPTPDSLMLWGWLSDAEYASADLHVEGESEAAYHRTVDRLEYMWTGRDPSARW